LQSPASQSNVKFNSVPFSTVAIWAATVAAGSAPDAAALAELDTDTSIEPILDLAHIRLDVFLLARHGLSRVA
jgi:hypothetical protein